MKYSQLAAQLFTVRDYLLNASAFADTIKRIKAVGYPAVELIQSETVSDKEIARICEDAGVALPASLGKVIGHEAGRDSGASGRFGEALQARRSRRPAHRHRGLSTPANAAR
jgi:hypothetical protein